MIPPIGTFATATTAISQAQPDIVATSQPPGSLKAKIGSASAHPLPHGSEASQAHQANQASQANQANQATLSGQANQPINANRSTQFQVPPPNPLDQPIDIPEEATIQGKLRVSVIEARGLGVQSNGSKAYVVVNCSTSEYISKSARNNDLGISIPQQQQQQQQLSSRLNLRNIQYGFSSNGQEKVSEAANPSWQDEAIFDVTSYNSDLEINVFDAGDNDRFLGRIAVRPDFKETRVFDQWYTLHPRTAEDKVSGEIHIAIRFEHTQPRHFGPQDFKILRLIGKGTFGQVYQVRKKDSNRVYAMKVLSKRLIVQRKEVAHTIGERDILVRTGGDGSNFLLGLKFSFQTATDLYLVTDYMSGGELFWHLQREGRFSEKRAKFYIAELIVALKHLHDNDIVYRDLKPENILLDASGHIALCDFGLSKANLHNGTTNTFCGTTEYLAPEVLLDDKGYTKMVDFWSLGVLIFEMCCGWSPFYAEDNQQMYKNIAFGKVRFPKDALSPEGRDFVKGLLNRNPLHRLGATNDAQELMAHPFFKDVDWDALKRKQIQPPYKPHVTSDEDTSNFDPEFTTASTSVLTRNMEASGMPLSPGIQDKFKGFTYVDDTLMDEYFKNKAPPQPVSASFRAPPPNMGRDEAIDLYDEKEIELSHSYFDSSLKNKFANEPKHGHNHEELMQTDEVDELMMDDDRDGNYDDFVEGQGFEM
mgnify:FL=1